MATTTPNLGLTLPAAGSTNWNVPVNENFTAIDTKVGQIESQIEGINTNSAPVTSVFGRTGAVAAAANDYSFAEISGTASASQLPVATASSAGIVEPDGTTITISNGKISAVGGGGTSAPVQSVFGRSGNVEAQSGDYSFSEISGSVTASQLPVATTSAVGAVQPDGTTITVNAGGVISAAVPSTISGTLAIVNGGTGATTAAGALGNLGAMSSAGGTMTGNLTVPTVDATGATSINATGAINAGSISASGAINAGSVSGGTVTSTGMATVGNLTFTGAGTATSADAGSASALPSLPAGYLVLNLNGTYYKLPFYNG